MLIAKVPAVVAAVLFMSSVSVKAMEFADRPGMTLDVVSSLPAFHFMLIDDYSRRQINNLNILLPAKVVPTRLVERPKPISNVIRTKVSQSDRPGRLSAEFSLVARGPGVKFEYGPGEVSSWLKPTVTRMAMKVEDRPGPISNLFPTMADAEIRFGGRDFTSTIAKTITRPGMRPQSGSAAFCVGSMAPCGSLSFARHLRMSILSAASVD